MEKKDFSVLEQNLVALGYSVRCFDTAAEAAEYLDSQIHEQTVGFAGSMTLEKMGLYERLSAHNEVFWHHRIPEGMTSKDVRLQANAARIYITSVNGIAESGEIVNIDATCNRVASIFYGHEKVYFVIGENKIAPDYDSALFRARNIAAPLNARRLGVKTPCAINADRCYDCKSPERICRGLSVLWSKPINADIKVILVHDDLGY